MARKRFRNVSGVLQILYDETGDKREVVPGGTIILEEKHGTLFSRFLEAVLVDGSKEGTKKTESEDEAIKGVSGDVAKKPVTE